MKGLVLESTAPFQGLPELVATTSTTNATPNHTNSCFACEPVERSLLDHGTPNS
jgi:hypothetical protein